jgi:orotate phosphoribosyltransferase
VEERTREFIDFLVRCDALSFGDFTAKSGRPTPYFVNTGRIDTGSHVARLGEYYAEAIMRRFGHDVDVIFGPAYKGIPLAVTTAIALHHDHGRDVGFCFDRKEAKDHGEGGELVGHSLADGDRVVIVEDVTTAGTSIRATVPMLRALADIQLRGLVVGVDRRERGTREDVSALEELSEDLGVETVALATIDDIVERLAGRRVDGRQPLTDDDLRRLQDYRERFGVA